MICWFHPFGSPRQKLTGQNKEWGSTSTKIHKAEREQSPSSTRRKKTWEIELVLFYLNISCLGFHLPKKYMIKFKVNRTNIL